MMQNEHKCLKIKIYSVSLLVFNIECLLNDNGNI
jgi:hypothetical protein